MPLDFGDLDDAEQARVESYEYLDRCQYHAFSSFFPKPSRALLGDPEEAFCDNEKPNWESFDGDRKTVSLFCKETFADVVIDEGGGYVYGAARRDYAFFPNLQLYHLLVNGRVHEAIELAKQKPVALLMSMKYPGFFVGLIFAPESQVPTPVLLEFFSGLPTSWLAGLQRVFNLQPTHQTLLAQASRAASIAPSEAADFIFRRAEEICAFYEEQRPAVAVSVFNAVILGDAATMKRTAPHSLTEVAMLTSRLVAACSAGAMADMLLTYAYLNMQLPESLVHFQRFIQAELIREINFCAPDSAESSKWMAEKHQKLVAMQQCLEFLKNVLPSLEAAAQSRLFQLLLSEKAQKLLHEALSLGFAPEATLTIIQNAAIQSRRSSRSL